MAEIQYKSSLYDWLSSKIVSSLVLVWAVGFMHPATSPIIVTLTLFSILLLAVTLPLLASQVILTAEGIKYRRFLRWKEKP